jgi:hypothetical protein
MVTLQPSPLALQLSLHTAAHKLSSISTNYICLNFCISYHAIHVGCLTGYRSGCRMLQCMYNSNGTIYNNLKIHISIGRTQTYLQCVCLVVPISCWRGNSSDQNMSPNRWLGGKNERNHPPKRPTKLERFFNTAIKLSTLTRVISAAVRLDIEHGNFTHQIEFLSISTEDTAWKWIKRFFTAYFTVMKMFVGMLGNYEFLFMNILVHEMTWIR